MMPLLPRRWRLWKGVKVWGPMLILLYVIVRFWSHPKTFPLLSQDGSGTEKQALQPSKQHLKGNAAQQLPGMPPQGLADYLGSYLQVQYEVVNNLVGENFRARISLFNGGRSVIPSAGWKVYFFHQRMIERDMMRSQGHALLANLAIRLKHVNGGLFTFEPTDLFPPLHPGSKLQIHFTAEAFAASRTDILPNWYVEVEGAHPRVLQSTAGESLSFVLPFNSPEKWKRFQTDHYDPFTAATRYSHNEIDDLSHSAHYIIPSPAELNSDQRNTLEVTQDWVIVGTDEVYNQAMILSESTGLRIQEDLPDQQYIHLLIVDTLSLPAYLYRNLQEAYTLHVNPTVNNIVIQAQTPAGLYYGTQSLLSLLDQGRTLPQLQARDAPRFLYRGIMVDLARNFITMPHLLKLIKVMAMYKMNRLHLHLTDDEAWRLEIPGLPELTKIGSVKCHDMKEEKCVIPSLGSGPDASLPGSGHLTAEQYKQLLRQARSHHIEVIPEIDMPGHARAAIKAMEARYRSLKAAGKIGEAQEYLLSDPKDKSKYESIQMFKDNVINPCMKSTFKFIDHVITQLVDLHKDILPLKTFHFGGDEVPSQSLVDSSACRRLYSLNAEVQKSKNLQEYFIRELIKITNKHKLVIQGWEDGFYAGQNWPLDLTKLMAAAAGPPVANAWMNRWEWGRSHRAYELANRGHKVVLSPSTHLYFDHQQEPDPEDRGMYWAVRYVDTRKVFSFLPDSFYDNIDEEISGKPLNKKKACADGVVVCLPLEENSRDNIIGMQGQIWGEMVRSGDHMFSQLMPRMLALAERAWHQAEWESEADEHERERRCHKDWQRFANTLGYKELRRLDRMNVPYYLPPPGAVIEDGELKINSAFPGLVIQYSSDGGDSWHDLKSPTHLSGTLLLSTRSHNEKRRSRSVPVFIS